MNKDYIDRLEKIDKSGVHYAQKFLLQMVATLINGYEGEVLDGKFFDKVYTEVINEPVTWYPQND